MASKDPFFIEEKDPFFVDDIGAALGNSVQETQHPTISNLERFLVKNLANSPEAAVKYLQKKHPDLTVELRGNDVVARGKNKKEPYQVLDPQTGFWDATTGEKLKDIGDAGYDIASSIGSGAATSLGSSIGAALGGGFLSPVTALLGASAASGASSAALEALRQKLGKAFGIPQEVNMNDVIHAGKVGAVVPAAAKGLGMLIKLGANKGFPALASWTSGVPSDVIKTTMKRLPEMAAAEAKGVLKYGSEGYKKLSDSIFGLLSRRGKELASAVEKTGKNVDISEAKKPIQNLIAELEPYASEINNPLLRSELRGLERAQSKIFSAPKTDVTDIVAGKTPEEQLRLLNIPAKAETVKSPILDEYGKNYTTAKFYTDEVPDVVTPKSAWKLQKQISDLARQYNLPTFKQLVSTRGGGEQAGKRLTSALDEADKAIGTSLDKASEGVVGKQKLSYKEIADLRKNLDRYFGDETKTYKTLTTLETKSGLRPKALLKEVKDKTGIDLFPRAEILRAQAYMGDTRPGGLPWHPISSGGTTSTSRSLGAGGLGLAAGNAIEGAVTGSPSGIVGRLLGVPVALAAGSPAAIKNYIKIGKALGSAPRGIEDFFVGAGIPRLAVRSAPWSVLSGLTKQNPWTLEPEKDPFFEE